MLASPNSTPLTLDHFSGPLDLLVYLVQKSEVDPRTIPILSIFDQFEAKDFDNSAEFIGLSSLLLWLKSRLLLPSEPEEDVKAEELELDPRFEIIHELLEYCKVKDLAKDLSSLEKSHTASFARRGTEELARKKPPGVNHLSTEDLAVVFSDLLKRAESRTGTIEEEEWKVADKISYLKQTLMQNECLTLAELFPTSMGRQEMIVTFLAILEMMKIGKLCLIQDDDSIYAKGN